MDGLLDGGRLYGSLGSRPADTGLSGAGWSCRRLAAGRDPNGHIALRTLATLPAHGGRYDDAVAVGTMEDDLAGGRGGRSWGWDWGWAWRWAWGQDRLLWSWLGV
jgi:hypothetical protein